MRSRSLRARGAGTAREEQQQRAARQTKRSTDRVRLRVQVLRLGGAGLQQTLAARQDDPGSSDPCLHRRERLTLRYVPQSLPFRTEPTAVHDCRTLVANGSGSNLTSVERYRQSGTLPCLSYKLSGCPGYPLWNAAAVLSRTLLLSRAVYLNCCSTSAPLPLPPLCPL